VAKKTTAEGMSTIYDFRWETARRHSLHHKSITYLLSTRRFVLQVKIM
jgi:hypothetical protein